jgi:hypothetical protein
MTFWALWFIWTSLADWAATLMALEAGAVEGNPLMGWLVDYPLWFFAAKLVIPSIIAYYLWDWGTNGKVVLGLGGLAFAMAAVNSLILAGVIG